MSTIALHKAGRDALAHAIESSDVDQPLEVHYFATTGTVAYRFPAADMNLAHELERNERLRIGLRLHNRAPKKNAAVVAALIHRPITEPFDMNGITRPAASLDVARAHILARRKLAARNIRKSPKNLWA